MTASATPMTIRPLAPAAASDAALVAQLTQMINAVFLEAEAGLLREGILRTTVEEVQASVAAGDMQAAFTAGGQLGGCVRVQELEPGNRQGDPQFSRVAEFGMLAVPAEHRRGGLGRRLVAAAEDQARRRGFEAMQLELFAPVEGGHEFKDFLIVWYAKLGYREMRRMTMPEFLPHKPDICIRECDVLISVKAL